MRSGFPETPVATTSPSSSCFHFLSFLLLPHFSISLFLQYLLYILFSFSVLPVTLLLIFYTCRASCASGDYIRDGSKAAKMEGSSKITWADYKVPVGDSPGHDPSDVAVVSQIGKDSRKWNYLHYSAVRNPEIMRGLLEKCRGDDSKKWDVNTPGPGGYTPLMLAVTQKSSDSFPLPSRSSSSSESSGEHTEHNGLLFSPMTKAMQFVPHSDTSSPSGSFTGSPFNCSVDVLLSTRVKLDATNDYGRTGLHLAAVCARGDYVKKLLAAGANPNVQDNWGQSALHAAIGAAAEGAFQVS